MLITPRIYSTSQIPDSGMVLSSTGSRPKFNSLAGWSADSTDAQRAAEMLLTHQAGSVHVGEVVRYTLTYTPAADPILPTPAELYVKVKNTSATPLRAAYLHGPYTLYTACYPSTFDPNVKYDGHDTEGIPQFEPYLKAGGTWDAVITVPQHLRQRSQRLASSNQVRCERDQSVTWVIEIISQVVFSNTATVHFELLVGRDEKSINILSTSGVSTNGLPPPAQIYEHWPSKRRGDKVLATKGVYSKSIRLVIEDTASLWNSPPFPTFEKKGELGREANCSPGDSTVPAADPRGVDPMSTPPGKKLRKKRIHFVVLTHGLHSNLGADMLYLKESIDAAARKASEQAKESRNRSSESQNADTRGFPKKPGEHGSNDGDSDDEGEQVIVRGFPGNAARTERGIQYLGKRLAKYVLLMTYPDQPYLPLKSPKAGSFPRSLRSWKGSAEPTVPPLVYNEPSDCEEHAYRITSISFIGHSLGGLIQTYAIAYIQKHSPQFFEQIRPVSFIALATPFLGLSNENPLYVRFALDFGLVGRTGQDLGLSWTAPKVRSGWGAMIGGKGGESLNTHGHSDPGSKPLLRILPSGPAHEVLLKFQHRTVYSNVVNDGIVPLRTSSLLFLDWRGLDRVEKARRENGLVGTMAEWGWAELTGANSKFPRPARPIDQVAFGDTCHEGDGAKRGMMQVGIPLHPDHTVDDTPSNNAPLSPTAEQYFKKPHQSECRSGTIESRSKENSSQSASIGPLNGFFSMFRLKEAKSPPSNKQAKIYKRSQTLNTLGDSVETLPSNRSQFPAPIHGDSLYEDDGLHTPPKTTFFESAGDLLMPPLPPTEFIIDPASRPRTIFHDRVYHPEDIPTPLPIKRRTLALSSSHSKSVKSTPPSSSQSPETSNHNWNESESGLKVEEKIARAYHRDLSWRKVLVRLEPDAHNNIIVRRMFTNAYGWPVVKHLVDTHFGYTAAAQSCDTLERGVERARPPNIGATSSGDEVEGQTNPPQRIHPPNIVRRNSVNTPDAADCKFVSSESSVCVARPGNIGADGETRKPSMNLGSSKGELGNWSECRSDDGHEGLVL